MNRLELDSVYVRDVVKLDANHMVIVYKQMEGHIERRIVQDLLSSCLVHSNGKP